MKKKIFTPIKLHELNPVNRTKNKKRVGRGIGSNRGKTSTSGHKGQRSRSGHKIGSAFEGGQMPYYRRIPKSRGFRPINKLFFQIVNLAIIEEKKLINVNPETLLKAGLIKKLLHPIKILGNDKINTKLICRVHAISKTAHNQIISAQGKVELIK